MAVCGSGGSRTVDYFFEGLADGADAFKATPQQRMVLELARNFLKLTEPKHREAVCSLARTLAAEGGE